MARRAHRSSAGQVAMDDDAVDDVELVRARLQQRGRDIQRLGPNFERRGMRRVARHDRGARGVGADAVLDAIRLSRYHPHPAVVEAQRIGTDLRHRGGEPLADRRTASHQLDHAGGIYGDPGAVHWSKPAFLDEDRDSAPDQFAGGAAAAQLRLQRFPADLRERLIQQSRIVAGIVDDLAAQRAKLPGKRHFGRGDEVASTDRHPVEPEPVGDGAESVITGRKSGAEMARLYNVSQPTVSRIVAQHRMVRDGQPIAQG